MDFVSQRHVDFRDFAQLETLPEAIRCGPQEFIHTIRCFSSKLVAYMRNQMKRLFSGCSKILAFDGFLQQSIGLFLWGKRLRVSASLGNSPRQKQNTQE